MKRIACLLFCLGSQAAYALSPDPFEGLYVTGALGATNAQFYVSPNATTFTAGILDTSFPGHLNLDGTQAAGLVSLSYSHQFSNHIVLSGAVTAGYTRAKASDNNNFLVTIGPTPVFQYNSEINSELTNDFALLFKPGYLYKQTTLFYGLVGPRWGNFKTSVKSQFLNIDNPGTFTAQGSDSTSGYKLGVTVGLGIQQLITSRFNLGLEYAYTSYGGINSPHISGIISLNQVPLAGTSFIESPDIDVTSNTLMLTFSYRC